MIEHQIMFNVNLQGFVDEPDELSKTEDKKGWIVWKALKLHDEDSGTGVAEWFYTYACNEYFAKNELDQELKLIHSIQEEYDESALYNNVKNEFAKLKFQNIDDFYEKMNIYFLHED